MENPYLTNDVLRQFIVESLRAHPIPMRKPRNGNMMLEVIQRDGFIKKIVLKESYIVKVLGIKKKRLMESLDDVRFRRMVLREHLLFEGWWDKAKEFVGDSIDTISKKATNAADILKKYGEDAKGVIASLWAAVADSSGESLGFLKNAFGNYMSKQTQDIKKVFDKIQAGLKKLGMPTLAAAVEKIVEFIRSFVEKIQNIDGWIGLMSAAAGMLGFNWIRGKIVPGLWVVADALDGKIEDFVKTMAGAAAGVAEDYKEVFNIGSGNPGEVIKSFILDKLAGLIPDTLKKLLGQLAGDAIVALAGPMGWLTKAYDVFQGSKYVLGVMSDGIRRANFRVRAPTST